MAGQAGEECSIAGRQEVAQEQGIPPRGWAAVIWALPLDVSPEEIELKSEKGECLTCYLQEQRMRLQQQEGLILWRGWREEGA